MVIYVNNKNEIKDVGSTNNPNLIPLTILDEDNPFDGWSVAKICCYKVKVNDGNVELLVPYVDVKIVEFIDRLGKENEELSSRNEELKQATISTQAQLDYIAMMTDVEI